VILIQKTSPKKDTPNNPKAKKKQTVLTNNNRLFRPTILIWNASIEVGDCSL